MEPKKSYKGLVEVLGMVAVVGSLIFVGLEVRQNASATRGATQQQLSAAAREVTLLLAEPDIAELWQRAASDRGSLSAAEERSMFALALATFRVYEDAYYQFRIGNLDSELWRGWEASLADVVASTLGDHWSELRHLFFHDFQLLVDGLEAPS